MAMPRKLKNQNIFNDANSYQGVAKSVTLPDLTRKLEMWRGAGMDGAVGADLGMGDDGLKPAPVRHYQRQRRGPALGRCLPAG
jgi:P2 family phage contractile tail tube protein